ncbi:MAG: PAS domain S-box protein [Bacteroidota bacterium]
MYLFIGATIFLFLVFQVLYVLAKLKSTRRKYQTLLENAGDAVVIIDKNGRLVHASASIKKVLGYTVKEAKGLDVLSLAHPDDILSLQAIMAEVMAKPGIPVTGHTGRMKHADGTWHWYEAVVTNMLHDPDVLGIVDNFRDVSDAVQAVEKMNNANRLYAFISQINQAIVHSDSPSAVFHETCRIAVEYGKFNMAWIGTFNDEKTSVSLVAERGMVPETLSNFKERALHENGPMYRVARSGESYICNDMAEFTLPEWKAFAHTYGIKSFMILPIKKNDKTIGALNLYASQCGLFDEQERTLLEEVAGDISFAMNMFERERLKELAEKKHRDSELTLKQAQSIAHVGSFEIDFSTGISTWSEELCRIYGYAVAENKHHYDKWIDMIHPDDLLHVMAIVDEAKATKSSSAIYHRIILSDGAVKHIFSQGEYEFNDQGKVTGLHGVAHDITAIKKSEGQRYQSESNLQLIMDLIPQGIFVKDLQGNYLFVNRSFAQLHGKTPEEFLQQPHHFDVGIEQERDQFLSQDQQVIKSGVSLTIPELPLTMADGSTKYFYTVKVPYTLSGELEPGMLGIALDITEQKNAELERAKIMQDLTQRNKDLEQFSYVVSHNVRAPLVNIIALIKLLDPECAGEDGREVISALAESTNKLDHVIKDLNLILNMSHKINEARQPVSFTELINDIKVSIANIILSGEASLRCDFSAIDHMDTFKSYLYSIFYNLILNSIKYRKPGIPAIIMITSKCTQTKVFLEFTDNGLGIDMKRYGDQLFGLYKRFLPEIPGKGMGLYMVKLQVEQLRGTISASSSSGSGATFYIEFDVD